MGPEKKRNSLLEAAVPCRDRLASRAVDEWESSGDFQKECSWWNTVLTV